MIPDDLRREVVALLMRIPLASGDHAGRTALLAGIPQAFAMSRNPGNSAGDIMLIVSQVEESYGPDGKWNLIRVIDTAMPLASGVGLGRELTDVRAELLRFDAGRRPPKPLPTEVAQIHLFDLRAPVLTCAGMLPDPHGTAGFALFSPTPRLLGHFCESLKHRGAEFHRWSRHEVGVVATLVVDPRHTGPDQVLDKLARIRPLLARRHVIFPLYAAEASDVADIWHRIARDPAPPGDHHLVIVLGMPPGSTVPEGVTGLPEPRFTTRDVREWVDEIGRLLPWQSPQISHWADVILREIDTDEDGCLSIDMVYETLDIHSTMVQMNRTPEELMNALELHEAMGPRR